MSDNSKLTDEEIIEKVRSENPNIYAIVIDRYKDKLLRYATNLVRDKDKASHVVQDAFIKGYVNLNGFDTKKKFSSWIYRIVHNEAMNVVKKHQQEVPILDDFDFESEEDVLKDFEQKEITARVEKCLNSIPLIYSEPLSLYYLDNKSYEEISDILRIPMGTVAVRINRAKKLMKNICQKN
ncbi:MAG: RNA polymerase sigma factor [Parcubacteria group bacterium]|jgi:RNA polymerase sigma-70 factor (ECF subfamily)|nr:RNA polymerase sigma factor [Parcubacteria group bacterium]